jgi:hypothetical protein
MPGANMFASSVVDAFYANNGQHEFPTDTSNDAGSSCGFPQERKLQ